jgi:hypothetical protein
VAATVPPGVDQVAVVPLAQDGVAAGLADGVCRHRVADAVALDPGLADRLQAQGGARAGGAVAERLDGHGQPDARHRRALQCPRNRELDQPTHDTADAVDPREDRGARAVVVVRVAVVHEGVVAGVEALGGRSAASTAAASPGATGATATATEATVAAAAGATAAAAASSSAAGGDRKEADRRVGEGAAATSAGQRSVRAHVGFTPAQDVSA